MLHLICPGGSGFAVFEYLAMLFGISAGRAFVSSSFVSLLISFLASSLCIPLKASLAKLFSRKSSWLSVFDGVGLVGVVAFLFSVPFLLPVDKTGLKPTRVYSLSLASPLTHL
jgi:hypothetical protein